MRLDDDSYNPLANADFPSVCRTCTARRYGICGALNTPQLASLGVRTRRRQVARGTVLVLDAEETKEYANIVSGVVKLSKTLEDGRQQIVGLQFPPEFLGRPFSGTAALTAEAASDVELCLFPKSAIESMLMAAPEFQRRLLEQTLLQLEDARGWMLLLGRKTAAEKVATVLVSLMDHAAGRAEEGGGLRFDMILTRAEIADFLGLTIETVSRELTKLRRAGIVAFRGRHCTVADPATLRAATAE